MDSISLTSSQVEALEQSNEAGSNEAGSTVVAELEAPWDSGDGVSDFLSVSELQQRTASARETSLSCGGRLAEMTRKRPHPEADELPAATRPKSPCPL